MANLFDKDHAKGKALRSKFPREAMAEWKVPSGRVPIIEQIKAERSAGQGPSSKQIRSSGASHGTGGVDPNTGLPPAT